jgi:hypothetical protein
VFHKVGFEDQNKIFDMILTHESSCGRLPIWLHHKIEKKKLCPNPLEKKLIHFWLIEHLRVNQLIVSSFRLFHYLIAFKLFFKSLVFGHAIGFVLVHSK